MTQLTVDLILHPVRMRVLMLLNRHSPATAAQLLEHIPDASLRSLYRHLDELRAGGMIQIAKTQRVRGAVERYYELARPAVLSVDELNSLTPEEGKQLLIYIVSLLQAEFLTLLDSNPAPNRLADSCLRIGEIAVSPAQMQTLVGELLNRAAEMEANAPTDGTTQAYRISLIAFPRPKSQNQRNMENGNDTASSS
jgi:DNA-binding transcriptional ArsR family regulator